VPGAAVKAVRARDGLAREKDGCIGAPKGRDLHKQALGIPRKGLGLTSADVSGVARASLLAEFTVEVARTVSLVMI